MAEDIKTTLQLGWANRRVDFENKLHRHINKKIVQNIFIQNWVPENIVPQVAEISPVKIFIEGSIR